MSFFLLGAAKCGTSSLHYYLNQHPHIYMSEPKEPIFFEAEFHKGIEYYYKTYFAGRTNETFLGESRHRNLYLPYVPLRIAKTFPKAKLIVILRNPIDRAYSHYFHRKIYGYEKLSFEDAISLDLQRIKKNIQINTQDEIQKYVNGLYNNTSLYIRSYVDSGYYSEQIERYLKYFSREQMFITFIDDFKEEPQKEFNKLIDFLGAEPCHGNVEFEIINKKKSKAYQYVKMILAKNEKFSMFLNSFVTDKFKNSIRNNFSKLEEQVTGKKEIKKETRVWLSSHYRPYNKRLEELTGRNLSRWDEKY